MITKLEENEIFVFGSNLAGRHELKPNVKYRLNENGDFVEVS